MIPLFAMVAMMATPSEDLPRRAMPTEPPAHWFSNDDYPLDAIRREVEGTVGFRLQIDAEGRVVGCTVIQSSKDESLDEATCRIAMSRAAFEPARDASGRAVPDYNTSRIRWVLPEEEVGMPFGPLRDITVLEATSEGLSGCRQERNGVAAPALPVDQCSSIISSDAIEQVESYGTDAKIAFVISFTPAGLGPGEPPSGLGNLIFERSVDVTIAPDGSVADCSPVDKSGGGLDPCSAVMEIGETLFEPVLESAPQRGGRVTVSTYEQIGVTL